MRHPFHFSTSSIISALVLMAFTGCGGEGEVTVDFEPLEGLADSVTSAGKIHYPERSYDGWQLTVNLEKLRPQGNYWLCINACSPEGPESGILGSIRVSGWPEGQFDEKGEGYWDFATITADDDGSFSDTFLVPLKEHDYAAKLLVKDIREDGSAVLQAEDLRFQIKDSSEGTGLLLVLLGAISAVAIALVVVLLVYWQRRKADPGPQNGDGHTDERRIGYTQQELNRAVEKYLNDHIVEYQRLVDLIRGGDTEAAREAKKLFSPQAIREALKPKTRTMLNKSPAYKRIRRETALPPGEAPTDGRTDSPEDSVLREELVGKLSAMIEKAREQGKNNAEGEYKALLETVRNGKDVDEAWEILDCLQERWKDGR